MMSWRPIMFLKRPASAACGGAGLTGDRAADQARLAPLSEYSKMMNAKKLRFVGPTVLAGICAVLAVLTAIWPQWIEEVFGVEPDQGSGSFEWLVVLSLGIVAAISAEVARRECGRSLHRA
jgi:hypothetical protein